MPGASGGRECRGQRQFAGTRRSRDKDRFRGEGSIFVAAVGEGQYMAYDRPPEAAASKDDADHRDGADEEKSGFLPIEKAALQAILRDSPACAPQLEAQLERARVLDRRTTGGGFMTDIDVPESEPPLQAPAALSTDAFALVEGVHHSLGFALFIERGRVRTLAAYADGPECGAPVDYAGAAFRIVRGPLPQSQH